VVHVGRAHPHEHERVVAGGRRPVAGPGRVVEPRADDPYVRRRGELLVLERPARHQEEAVGALEVLEHRPGRLEAVGSPGLVQLAEALVEQPPHRTIDRRVASAPERPARGLQPRSERRGARVREGQQVGHEERERNALRLSGDLSTEDEEVPHHRVRGAPPELGAHVRGEETGGAGHRPVAHTGEGLEGRLRVPVLHDHALRVEVSPLGRALPRHVLGAGRLDVRRQDAIGQHAHVVSALDHRPDDRRVGRHRAAAVDDREQVALGHGH
jgi:hypothetical protein